MDLQPLFAILAAALGGTAVGIERQWSGHASGPDARFGGVRTFTLLGGLAGLVGWLWNAGYTGPAAVLVGSAAALIVISYAVASRRDIDATTEVAALVVIAAGILCASGRIQLASGIIAVTCLLLLEKSRLHAWVSRLNDDELRAGVRFAVMAAVVLPLLPEGPFGPLGGIKPRELWLLVLFFSGISFVAYIARRAVGARYGYPVTGLLGGLVSSTNVAITFARASHSQPGLASPLASGVLAACTVMFLRVLVVAAVLNRPLAIALLPFLAVPVAVGVVPFLFMDRRHAETDDVDGARNPLQIREAVQMAALFQVVLMASRVARSWWGQPGVLISGAVLGLTDVDALTFTMAQAAAAGVASSTAAQALAIGTLSNTILKLSAVLVLGSAPFRRAILARLLGIAIALAAAIWWMMRVTAKEVPL